MVGLSKSRIAAFEQCPRRLWLQVHRRELADWGEGTEALFAIGNEVGEVACALHPNGVMIESEPDLAAALETTARLIAEDHPGPLFEATFMHRGVLVRVDVMERLPDGGWHVAEVKSSTAPKDYHVGDLATQVWVLQGCSIDVRSAAIRHVDNRFVLQVPGELDGLLHDADMLGKLGGIIAGRDEVVRSAQAVLAGEEPQTAPGDHCSSPHDCEFAAHCRRGEPGPPKWPVTVLPRGAGAAWQARGYDDLLDVPADRLSGVNAIVHAATVSGTPYHDRGGAAAEMMQWGWPRAWLDFETIAFAVPRWVGTRPYQQIPFQFSLHLEQKDGAMTHSEFLSTDGTDPRRACAEALVEQIPAEAAIIAYHAPFERGVLRYLAGCFPDLSDELQDMAQRCADLLPVTRRHWYHRDQRGSWSIKKVLPTMADLNYASLEVKDGGDAQGAYLEAIDPATDPDRRLLLREALLAYCERDTWAMVLIARSLAGEAI
jgi:hypothetical protein